MCPFFVCVVKKGCIIRFEVELVEKVTVARQSHVLVGPGLSALLSLWFVRFFLRLAIVQSFVNWIFEGCWLLDAVEKIFPLRSGLGMLFLLYGIANPGPHIWDRV